MPRERWLVGGEYERAVVRSDGRAVDYHDPDGIRWILERFHAETGWKTKSEGEYPVELVGEGASITLEPGGQVELSGAPFRRLSDLAAEVRRNRDLLHKISEGHDHRWIACGLTPFARITDIHFVPKGRYAVMRDYLPRVGPLSHWMMKGTCSVQANYDYSDEADCARKFHVALGLGPLNTAIFANSPIAEGRLTDYASYRGHVWTKTDPARTGFPASVRAGYTHARWVDYLLDTPMMFYMRDGRWMPAEGVTFRHWMEQGIDGCFPGEADWALHQTSVFPEVRVKRTIEIRGADAVNVDLAVGFCALWAGVLYGALDAAEDLTRRFEATPGTHEERHVEGSRHGMDARIGDRTAAEWARELGAIASDGLRAIGEDVSLLDPLLARIASGRSPARDVIDAWNRDPSPGNILATVAYI
jgi:glutamate--cysteine ligase